jgi:hypothetical protein
MWSVFTVQVGRGRDCDVRVRKKMNRPTFEDVSTTRLDCPSLKRKTKKEV